MAEELVEAQAGLLIFHKLQQSASSGGGPTLSSVINIAQLSVVPLNDKTLVINRETGKWAMLGAETAVGLPLLSVAEHDLPKVTLNARSRLLETLYTAGLWRHPDEPKESLNTLLLKLTKTCNYQCTYCYDMEPEDRLSHMPKAVAIAAVTEAISLAERRESTYLPDLTIVFHGGEPTLVFSLIEDICVHAASVAASQGKAVFFTGQTNLSRLNQHMVDISRKFKISWGISLDGPPEINDAFRVLRNGSGTHKYFVKALAEFPEFVKDCGILTTVNSATVDKLLDIARYFRDLGFTNWDWSPFQSIGLARSHLSQLSYDTEQLISSWNRLFDAVLSGDFNGFSVGPVVRYVHNFVFGPGPNMCLRRKCGAGRDFTSVSYDGSIEACDCIDKTSPLSKIGLVQIDTGVSLASARASEKADLIRSRSVETGKCGSCAWLTVCGGTCLAHAGTVHGVDSEQCRISMNAFTRIAEAIASGRSLRNYVETLKFAEPQQMIRPNPALRM